MDMKIRIPYRPVHIALFLLLAFLCYEAHQLVRHLVGAVFCGGFGSMTFTISTTRQPCSLPTLVTLSGPLLTYGLAWIGMLLMLRSPRYALFGYAIIFASFAPLRYIQTLTGRGDELVLVQQWFGVSRRIMVAVVVFLVGLPPLIAAFRAIANQRRVLVFAGSYLLPIPVLVLLLFGNKFLFETNGNRWQFGSFLGIDLIVLLADLVAAVLLILLAPRYLLPQPAGQPERSP